tara:strand:+ start:264 stop:1130 length:867 start_codon:yes stop_codon:yes gene_type:complete
MAKKVKLVYILGCGRSGSTLLDMILGNHKKIISTGECQFFDMEKISSNNNQFWKKVANIYKDKLVKNNRDINDVKSIKNCRYISLKEILKINNLGIPNNFKDNQCLNNFLFDNLLLFETIQEVSKKNILIDSSKTISRLFHLYNSKMFDIKVIYLHRNGLAFVNSGYKKGLTNIQSSLHWTIRNYRSQKLLKQCNLEYLEISYDNLVNETESTISSICNFLKLDFKKSMLNFSKNQNLIGGNPVMRDNNNFKIEGNIQWKKSLSLFDKLIFGFIGGKMNKKLGYNYFG